MKVVRSTTSRCIRLHPLVRRPKQISDLGIDGPGGLLAIIIGRGRRDVEKQLLPGTLERRNHRLLFDGENCMLENLFGKGLER